MPCTSWFESIIAVHVLVWIDAGAVATVGALYRMPRAEGGGFQLRFLPVLLLLSVVGCISLARGTRVQFVHL